jgi:hypothetical protein
LKNHYCQLVKKWSDFDPSLTLKDAGVSHLSTWMLVSDAEVAARLGGFCSSDALPMHVKVKTLKEDFMLGIYSNLTVLQFLGMLASLLEVDVNSLKVTMVDETKIVRVDSQRWAKEDMKLPESERKQLLLKDIRVVHGTVFTIEDKPVDEQPHKSTESGAAAHEPEVIDLDDTEDYRTVIVNL